MADVTDEVTINGSDWMQDIQKDIDSLYALVAGASNPAIASSDETITGTSTVLAVSPAGLQAKTALSTRLGIVQLASDAEAITGTDATKAVTPHALAAKTGTEARTGVLQLASNAEAIAGSDTAKALTADDLAKVLAKLDIISFAGVTSPGPCTVTGVKAGDIILSVSGTVAGSKGDQSSNFEATVTVNDQIQQSGSTLSAYVYYALILRKS